MFFLLNLQNFLQSQRFRRRLSNSRKSTKIPSNFSKNYIKYFIRKVIIIQFIQLINKLYF